MPKLIVIVDKDDKGKIWDFVFNENEWHETKTHSELTQSLCTQQRLLKTQSLSLKHRLKRTT